MSFRRSPSRTILLPLALLPLSAVAGYAQTPEASTASGRPRVFLDCSNCPETEIRTQIPWVSWVRNASDSDVHVIVSEEEVGGGGGMVYFDIIGRGPYSDYLSRSTFRRRSSDTEREILDGALYSFALGLATFADVSGFRSVARIEGTEGAGEVVPVGIVAPSEVDDPWNLWSFRVNAGGNFNGESSRRGYNLNGGFTTSRTTPVWKSNTDASWNINNDERRSRDQETDEWNPWSRVDYRISWSANTALVYTLADHWSLGVRGGVARAVTQNQRLRFQVRPAIEYSYFPYEESTRRALTFVYGIGPVYRDYLESTVLGETSDLRVQHELSIGFSQRQPWGEASVNMTASALIPDSKYHNLSLSGNLSYRLTRGLSLNVSGSASRVKDQIYLANRGLTPEEELLRLRTAGTDYTYRGSLSLSYQFGSIYNNVVNNRFGSW